MPIFEITTITIGVLALVFTLVLTLVLFLMRRRYTARIDQLNDEIEEISQSKRYENRVTLKNGGSVSRLGSTVNQLFDIMRRKDQFARERTKLFTDLAESLPHIVVIHREKILYANKAAADVIGVDKKDLKGKQIYDLIRPSHRNIARDMIKKRLAGEEVPESYELELISGSEEPLWVRASGSLIDYEGEPAVLGFALDITHEKTLAQVVGNDREQAKITLESIGEGVITTDTNGCIDYLNAAAEQLTGSQNDDAIGKTIGEIISLVDEGDRRSLGDPVKRCLSEGRRVSLGRRALMLSHNGGDEYSIDLAASPVRDADGEIVGAVVVLHDVTEIRGLTRQMSYQASHDALTGLINRREFERRLEEALQGARAGDVTHALCYLDLDGFKTVNDTCGHMAGDNMLREVAGLIKNQIRDSDTVARLGGDEFGVLLIGCPLEKGRQIAGDVCHAVKDYRFVWRDKIFNIGVSIGLVEVGHESGEVEDALSAADSACYVAKKSGKGQVHVYSAHDEAVARHRGEIQWLQRLQSALKENRFELYTQPIVSFSGKVESGPALEVLLRMQDEHGRKFAPREFMRAAERYALMPHVDRWVVQTTLAAMGQEALRLPKGRSCAINLSGQTLADESFLEFVVECLDSCGVDPGSICFEVNETSVIANVAHASRFIDVLHGMGCQFALDDFGSGMGSFATLKNLNMDFLKIDGSYIRNLDTDSVSQAMVSAMMKLARTLNFRVVAEHVESQASFEAARRMGVDFAQGFAIGRPQPLHASR